MTTSAAGSSSLSYLSVLPVDVIKIDRLFIDGLPESNDDRAIVSAVLSLAEELDLAVIAEGVENDRQHWSCRRWVAGSAQGSCTPSQSRPRAGSGRFRDRRGTRQPCRPDLPGGRTYECIALSSF